MECSLFVSAGADLGVPLGNEGKADTAVLGELDESLLALADNENVGQAGGERVAVGISDVDNLVRTGVLLKMHEGADTTDIVSAGDGNKAAVLEFNNAVDLATLKVKLVEHESIKYNSIQSEQKKDRARRQTYLDSVVLLDVGVGVADGPAIVGHNIRNFVFADHLLGHLAKFEGRLLGINAHWLEPALDVVQNAEVFARLRDRDDIHGSEREPGVAAHLVVNFDIARLVLADLNHLLAGEGVLESVAEEHRHGDALSQLVGAGGGASRVHAAQLVQTPVGGRKHALHMLLWSSCLQTWYNPPVSLACVKVRLAAGHLRPATEPIEEHLPY